MFNQSSLYEEYDEHKLQKYSNRLLTRQREVTVSCYGGDEKNVSTAIDHLFKLFPEARTEYVQQAVDYSVIGRGEDTISDASGALFGNVETLV